uniref:ARAD1A08910p n=1 Tax=Blastobotrys adeninivorans TaxID=409370 RepID=A0A060T2J5_BLAAD
MTHEIENGTLQQLKQTVQELRKERADAKEVIAVLTARTGKINRYIYKLIRTMGHTPSVSVEVCLGFFVKFGLLTRCHQPGHLTTG